MSAPNQGGIIWTEAGLVTGPEGILLAAADLAAVADSLSVERSEDIAELSARASRHGIGSLSPREVLILVIACLLLGVPVLQQHVPRDTQALLSNEYMVLPVTVAIIIAVLARPKP